MRRAFLHVAATAIVLMVLAGLGHRAHQAAAAAFGLVSEQEEAPRLYLPNPVAVRILSFGQRTTASDLYFLKTVQYIGTPAAEMADWPQLLELADLSTDLDREYGYPYEVAGVLLSAVRRFEESNQILAKGMDSVPERWQLPFFAAYNYWFELQDYAKGAELLWRASRLPDCPLYVSQLAARLSSTTDSLKEALAFVESTHRSDGLSEKVRQRMELRRNEILVEMDLKRVEAAISEHRASNGKNPSSLAELTGVLGRLPVAPDGTSYEYDADTGEVRSPLLPVRLRFTPPPKQ